MLWNGVHTIVVTEDRRCTDVDSSTHVQTNGFLLVLTSASQYRARYIINACPNLVYPSIRIVCHNAYLPFQPHASADGRFPAA
jgi:hypothetical protein